MFSFGGMTGQIYIIGDIGQFNKEDKYVDLVDVISQVRAQPDADSFDVFIDSPGGKVNVGMDIYNYLKSLGKPLHTIGMNMVASMATVIHLAGDTRTIRPNTQYMIHLPWGGVDGTSEEIEEYSKSLKATEGQLLDFYVKNTNNPKEAILPLLKEETWLSAEELLALGFISELPVAIAAKAEINNNPKKVKMSENKSEGILQKILDALTKSKDPAAKTIFTADQNELVFEGVEDADMVKPGDKATIDGKPAEGDITLADGRVFTFAAGELIEITEFVDDDGLAEELAAKVAELEALTAKYDALVAKHDALKAESDTDKAIIAKIEKLGSSFVAERKKDPKKREEAKRSRFGTALENMNAKK